MTQHSTTERFTNLATLILTSPLSQFLRQFSSLFTVGLLILLATTASAANSNLRIGTSVEVTGEVTGCAVNTLAPMTFEEALEAGDELTTPFRSENSVATRERTSQLFRLPGVRPTGPAGGGLIQRPTDPLNFTCNGFACTCTGDADCNDMFTTDVCGDFAVCFEDNDGGVWCLCER